MADSEEQVSSGMFSIERSEFDRLQMQLIELRTTNYQLKEQHSKSTAELTRQQQTVQSQARELEKANKTIQRSKKAKEFSTLVEENDSIQRKLERQEEDFRLQNRTLMDELAKVCVEKDDLESQLERAKRGGLGGGDSEDRVTQLQAENAALLKSIQGLKDQLSTTTNEHSEDGDTEPSPQADDKVMELELKLSTEEEKGKILQTKLTELQEVSRKQQQDLESELEKWTDKAKKKQDSLVQLQEEKEKQFYENRSGFNEMVRAKDHEIQTLQSSLRQAQRDLDARNEESETSQDVAKQVESLRTSHEEMNLRLTVLVQDKEALVKEKSGLQELVTELGRELHQAKADVGEEKKMSQDLMAQLEEAKLSQEQLADQVVHTSEEKHKMTVELETLSKLAEKRKSILDEMAIKGQQSASEQQRKVGEIEEQYKDEISKLEDLLQQEQSRNWKLTESVEELPVLREKWKAESERSESLTEKVQELETTMSRDCEENTRKISEMEATHQQQRKELEETLEATREELKETQQKMEEMETELEDKQEAVRIVERKSQSMLKDLKRQVQQMQKREDRLQEQVSEMRGVQTLDIQREVSHDTGSTHSRESSLSSTRGLIKVADTPDTPGLPFPTYSNQASVPDETQELLSRVALLQQEKWTLEEKVNHLENTGSALAEDIIQKSEIIKTYFMETKADHSPQVHRPSMAEKLTSPMKMMPWSRNKEETLEEINRKMQRALEEALMKNIHLQQNMEMLSMALEQAEKKNSPSSEHELPDEPTSKPTAEIPDS